MAIHQLTLQTLDKLDDGRVLEAWNQAMRRAVADCEDRPGCLDARQVTLKLDLVPEMDETGVVSSIKGAFQISDKAPTRKSRVYDFAPRPAFGLVFNDMSEDNVHQRTLDQQGGFDAEGSN